MDRKQRTISFVPSNLIDHLLITLLDKYIDWIQSKKGKRIVLLIFSLLTLLFGWNLQYLTIDFEFEKFFPRNDPDSQRYAQHREQFGYDNDFLLLIIENKEGLFNSSFLTKAQQFEKSLPDLEDVEHVLSPVSQKHLVNGPTGLLSFPLIHVGDDEKLRMDSIRIFSNPFYSSSFTEDRKAYSIYLTHKHFQDQERSQLLIEQLKLRAADFSLPNIRIVGKLTAQNVFIELIQKDFGKYLLGSIVLSFLVLLVLYRSFHSAILPFFISVSSIVWLFGLMGLCGVQINLLSSLLPPILFFVSMSDAIHLTNAVYRADGDRNERMRQAIEIVWTPTLLTSVTTAIGFLSLLWINTQPIQSLGTFAAIGILIAFAITFSIGLIVSTSMKVSESKTLVQVPSFLLSYLVKNKVKTLVVLAAVIGLFVPGILRITVDAYLLDDLPKGTEVRQDFAYVDAQLGGSKPYEIRIEAKSPWTVWDKSVMDEINKIEKYLNKEYPLARIQSPSTILKYLHQANNGGLNQNYDYPNNKGAYQKAKVLARRLGPEITRKIITEDQQVCRIVGFIPEYGSLETGRRNAKLLDYLRQNIHESVVQYHITGTTFLIDKSHELLSVNLIKGLLTAILTIGIVLGIYFRSFRLLIISLIPNVIPLLIIAGILGWMDISLKMTTSIIFTIAFGIAVDDTIHMMSFYLKNRNLNKEDALRRTFHHAGSAMLITSIIVIIGFSLFLLSDFGATFYLGLFVCLSLLIALIIDLTLLPLLLLSTHAKNRRSST